MALTTLIKDNDFTTFAIGRVALSNNQLFHYNNSLYRFTGTVPYTISQSTPALDNAGWVTVGSGSGADLRTDLADPTKGARLVTTNVDYAATVDRTQYEKNRDYWSVKDYGAVGDGVADDTAAILAAQADNCRWYPPGAYKVTNPLAVRQMGVSDGPGAVVYNSVNYYAAHNVTWTLDLLVPSVFPTIQEACDFAALKEISTGLVRVLVADGEHIERNITPRVRNWQKFQIIGNLSNPRLCGIKVDPTSNACGFIFADGYGIGQLDGFTIYGVTGAGGGWVSEGVWNSQCYGAGVFAIGTGSVICGSKMIVEYLYYGFRAKFGAYMYAANTQANHCGDCCYHAYSASMIASGSTATYARHTNGENLGFGFCAEGASHMECEVSTASYCQVGGYYSLGNSSMWAHSCESHHNIGHGFFALNGGYLEANGHSGLTPQNSNAFDNGGVGYYALNGGIIQTNMTLAARNGGGNYATANGGINVS